MAVVRGYTSERAAKQVESQFRSLGCTEVTVTKESGTWTVKASGCPVLADKRLPGVGTKTEAEAYQKKWKANCAVVEISQAKNGKWTVVGRHCRPI
jgi:hypothetical protein